MAWDQSILELSTFAAAAAEATTEATKYYTECTAVAAVNCEKVQAFTHGFKQARQILSHHQPSNPAAKETVSSTNGISPMLVNTTPGIRFDTLPE